MDLEATHHVVGLFSFHCYGFCLSESKVNKKKGELLTPKKEIWRQKFEMYKSSVNMCDVYKESTEHFRLFHAEKQFVEVQCRPEKNLFSIPGIFIFLAVVSVCEIEATSG